MLPLFFSVHRGVLQVFTMSFCEKMLFFSGPTTKTCRLSLPFSAINFKMTFTGGNLWPFYVPTIPFGMFAAFSAS